jgi:hypothetical protein
MIINIFKKKLIISKSLRPYISKHIFSPYVVLKAHLHQLLCCTQKQDDDDDDDINYFNSLNKLQSEASEKKLEYNALRPYSMKKSKSRINFITFLTL